MRTVWLAAALAVALRLWAIAESVRPHQFAINQKIEWKKKQIIVKNYNNCKR